MSEKIRKDIAEAMSGPDIKERFLNFGYVPLALDRTQFSQFVQSEAKRHASIIKRAKIELE